MAVKTGDRKTLLKENLFEIVKEDGETTLDFNPTTEKEMLDALKVEIHTDWLNSSESIRKEGYIVRLIRQTRPRC